MKKFVILSSALLSLFTANLQAQVVLQDSFTYPNGSLTNVAAGLWVQHSGTVNDSFVNGGRLEVFGIAPALRSADVSRALSSTLTAAAYASFIVNATNFSASTNYFAHFMTNSTQFRGRVFAAGPGVAANTWRLGISTAGGTGTQKIAPLDLATNVDYRVLIKFDNADLTARLWIDPVDVSDANTLAFDATVISPITAFGFRQSGPNPNLRVDDLYVGSAFADVAVGAPKSPIVYYQPPAGPTTNFVNNNVILSCVAGGAGTVTFQWQHAGTNLVDDANYTGSTSNVLSLATAQTTHSGAYRCIVTSTTNSVFFGSVTSIVSQLVITATPVPPTFVTQPVSQTAYTGQNVVFSTTVSSPGNVSYQWKSNNVNIAGETGPTLTLNNVTPAYSGSQFRVGVTNDVVPNGILSTNATLTVSDPATVSIAFLRNLVDPATFQYPPNSTVPYKIVGTVTTLTNVTSGNTSSYYLQDGTGGINIFATLGGTFRPQQGDVVTYVGVLSSFSSGLELFADTINRTYTSYSVTGTAPLPTPRKISFTVTNTLGYAYCATNLGGSLVTLTNVYFGANAGLVLSTNVNNTVAVTNANGESFNLTFFFVDLDTAGQTLPAFASSVTGVFYGNHPSYSVAVTKFSDIVTNVSVVPIPLNISSSGGTLTFNWSDPTFQLQSATNVVGPYTTISGAATGFSTNTLSGEMYFRLFHP